MDYFNGKMVVVTGASSGIGLALARRLRGEGAHLVMVARTEETLEKARAEVEALPGKGEVHAIPLDVSDRDAVFAALTELPSERKANILINNAGVTMPGTFLDIDIEEFERQMRINYFGSVWCTRALLPQIIEEGHGGHVAFVSSLIGLMGIFGHSAYAATKFAMRGLAESLRCELKPEHIGVSICYPPDTDTPQHDFEKQHLPPETLAIGGNAKCISPDLVAKNLLAGMARGCFDILPDGSSKFAHHMNRLFPSIVRMTFDGDIKKAQRKS